MSLRKLFEELGEAVERDSENNIAVGDSMGITVGENTLMQTGMYMMSHGKIM